MLNLSIDSNGVFTRVDSRGNVVFFWRANNGQPFELVMSLDEAKELAVKLEEILAAKSV